MASGKDVRAGKAFVELYIKNNAFVKGLRAAQQKLRDFGHAIQLVGKQMLAFGTLAATAFGLSVRTFANFDDKMRAVQAVTGSTADEFKRLYDLAKHLGATTSFTAGQVGEGMLSLGRAGFSASEIEAATAAVMNLARATGTELALSSDIASGTLRAFNLNANEMTRVADVLTATANGSAQTLEDLGEAMKYVAPIAYQAGESLEDTAKAVGLLANMQIKGSMAGTGYRQAMLSLASSEVQGKLRAVGVEAVDAAGNIRPMATVLGELGKAMATMGEAKRLDLAQELFGDRAATAIMVLSTSADMAEKLSEAVDKAGGKAAETAKLMDAGLGGALRILWSNVEGVAIAIGESLSDALSGTFEGISQILIAAREWIGANQEMIVRAAKVVAGVMAAGAAFVALGGTILALMNPITWVVGGLAALGWHFRETIGNILGDFTGAWEAITGAIAAGELDAAFAVVTTSVQLLWTKMTTWLTKTWQTFLKYWNYASAGLAMPMIDAAAAVQQAWASVLGWLRKTYNDVSLGIQTAMLTLQYQTGKISAAEYGSKLAAAAMGTAGAQVENADATAAAKRQIEENRRNAQDGLAGDTNRYNAARDAQIAAAEAELNAAMATRAGAVANARAAAARATTASPGGPGGKGSPPPTPADFAAQQAAIGRVAGTFSGSALGGMGTGIQDRSLRAQERSSAALLRLEKKMEKGLQWLEKLGFDLA